MFLSLIAALSEHNSVIGRTSTNDMPWSKHLKPDMNRFKRLTSGHAVIMGRKTWESLPPQWRPLPGRLNVVMTRDASLKFPGAATATSFEEAFKRIQGHREQEVFVIGGGEIYRRALPLAKRVYLTLVDEEPEGDVTFPPYEEFTRELDRHVVPDFSPRLTFVDLERA